jgi:hypothetical protein
MFDVAAVLGGAVIGMVIQMAAVLGGGAAMPTVDGLTSTA